MTLTLTHNISALFRVRNHFSLLAPIFSLNRNTHTLLPNTVAFMASADYAGNVIVFSPGPDEKITGHWYGYVTPNDVPALLDQHIAKGMVIQKLWRGQMGPATQVANGGDTDTVKQNNVESNNLSSNVNVGGCCQGVNGVSCCQTANFEQNKGIEETTGAHKKQGSETCLKWPALQQHNIITAAGVLGALAAIAVAYRFYRRSG
ncbi:hypothetical protein Ahy_A05g023491 isoform B [Arachis hypogaea]|uniref:Uncharacterized protein n=1 Tax=Arachis hypogaea TaxID=3818 RepID=A0A445D3I0_ARAHY|nr:hypothetical protein Ahy_A05g023491 isoform B [Arachis hypogaea]